MSQMPDSPLADNRPSSQAASPQAPMPPAAPPTEDAGTQALAEALRSSFRIVKALMIFLVACFVGSGIFVVKPNELAVVLRFGRPLGIGSEQLLKPGLHWAAPLPIDEIVRIPVGQSRTVTSTAGWLAVTPEMEAAGQTPPAYPFMRAGVDGYTLAADGNVFHARATLKYRLQPGGVLNYEFSFGNPTNLLKNALDNSLFYASTHFTADEAIFLAKNEFSSLVEKRVKQLINAWQLGVDVESVTVETRAPLDVNYAFDEVTTAYQTRQTRISEAETYARTATNAAQGLASVVLNNGITWSNQLVQNLAAEARSFSDQLPYYQSNPRLFTQRLLTETVSRVLTNAQDKFYIPSRADGKPREIRLQLSREPLEPTTPTTPQR
jgi:modulator of FtsH protease HflK